MLSPLIILWDMRDHIFCRTNEIVVARRCFTCLPKIPFVDTIFLPRCFGRCSWIAFKLSSQRHRIKLMLLIFRKSENTSKNGHKIIGLVPSIAKIRKMTDAPNSAHNSRHRRIQNVALHRSPCHAVYLLFTKWNVLKNQFHEENVERMFSIELHGNGIFRFIFFRENSLREFHFGEI